MTVEVNFEFIQLTFPLLTWVYPKHCDIIVDGKRPSSISSLQMQIFNHEMLQDWSINITNCPRESSQEK